MKKAAKLILWTSVNTIFIFPLFALAQQTPVNPGGDQTPVNPGNTGDCDSNSLCNPLGQGDIITFLQTLLNIIMIFAVPLIIFMIIYAGFTYVMAQGNETKVSTANRALLYAVIGGVIILGANVILAVIQGTVDSF